jgi:hypothetical protein
MALTPAQEQKEKELAADLGVPDCPTCKGTGIKFWGVTEFTMKMEHGMSMQAEIRINATLCSACSGAKSLPRALRRLVEGGVPLDDIPF